MSKVLLNRPHSGTKSHLGIFTKSTCQCKSYRCIQLHEVYSQQGAQNQSTLFGKAGTFCRKYLFIQLVQRTSLSQKMEVFQMQHRLTVLRTLGQGGYAKVYEVFNEDNELFALKVVDLTESRVKVPTNNINSYIVLFKIFKFL